MRVRGCALIQKDNKILVLAYDYPNGRIYALPGGGVKEGESLADSVTRELKEELGLAVEVGDMRYVGDMMERGKIKQTVHVVFDGRILDGEPILDNTQTSAVESLWLDVHSLYEVKLYPAVNDAILEDLHSGGGKTRYLGNCMRREWA
ncbi:MAG: NUDIX domain-containing protein [Acidobacteriota bacterium]|nr:NUDIX domain-containing protein [Acidobacteriota bacterium]